MTETLRIRLNDRDVVVVADPLTALRETLGEALGLRSVREPCGVGACGACTVVIDGRPVRSCLQPVGLVRDRAVTTIEGLAPDDPVVAAFAAVNAFQCGFCIPGFIMTVRALIAAVPAPTADRIREELVGNLCRCGSYSLILEAVLELVAAESEPDAPAP